ncbi:MAG TPA: hypothetical protein VHJ83_01755, partial [Micromonosporaceae bacterium]|nr:hypothetical protein [Micromonosporaceae bacterium]
EQLSIRVHEDNGDNLDSDVQRFTEMWKAAKLAETQIVSGAEDRDRGIATQTSNMPTTDPVQTVVGQSVNQTTERTAEREREHDQLRRRLTAVLRERDQAQQERDAALEERDQLQQRLTAALEERDQAEELASTKRRWKMPTFRVGRY